MSSFYLTLIIIITYVLVILFSLKLVSSYQYLMCIVNFSALHSRCYPTQAHLPTFHFLFRIFKAKLQIFCLPEEVEEVFAEDYDVSHRSHPPFPSLEQEQPLEEEIESSEEMVHECLACPNRCNLYHTCVDYCKKRWGFKKFKPDPELAKKHERLLSRYPLPSGWVEVGDPET